MAYDFSNPISFTNAGAGGQYGYENGLPVLNAAIADQLIQSNYGYVKGDAAGTADNAMGWDTGSVGGVLTNGAGIFDIKKEPEYAGQYPTGNFTYSGDMDAAAKQLGLNVSGLSDEQKYNLINDATKDIYLVSGKTGYQAGGVGENGQTPAIPGATTNHATVLYRKEGDALVPLANTAKFYNGKMELSPGSGLGDFFSAVAPIVAMGALAYGLPALSEGLASGLAGAGAAEGATGLASLPSSVLSATEAFGAGVSPNLISPAVLGMQAASAPLTSSSIADVFGDTITNSTPEFNQPITTGNESVYNWNNVNLNPNMTAIDAANAAGAGSSNTALANQLISGGTDFTNVAPGSGYTSQGGPLETSPSSENIKKIADTLRNVGGGFPKMSLGYGSGIGQGYTIPNPFFVPKEQQIIEQTKATQPIYLGQLANLLRG